MKYAPKVDCAECFNYEHQHACTTESRRTLRNMFPLCNTITSTQTPMILHAPRHTLHTDTQKSRNSPNPAAKQQQNACPRLKKAETAWILPPFSRSMIDPLSFCKCIQYNEHAVHPTPPCRSYTRADTCPFPPRRPSFLYT